ncbi:MAG: quinone oxidoreductase [Planctomycetota bacterium]
MHAIRIHDTGGADVLRYEEILLPAPGRGEVRVRHEAAGVNYIDIYHRAGLYPLPGLPSGLGVEAAGVVETVGEGVTSVAEGDRVAYVTSLPGCYAEARNVSADLLLRLPEGIGTETAAAVMLKGLTAEYLIRRAFRVEPGMTVLFHAAAGGVGLIACQWLAHLGATVIGTVGSEEKARTARAHGCAHPIVYTEEDFVGRVGELTGGQGVPVVYDSVGRATFERSLDCLARRGTLVAFGNASGTPDPLDALVLAQKGSLYLTRPSLFDYIASREDLEASAEALFAAVASGIVRPAIHHRRPLAEAAQAHRDLETRRTTGSTILVP